MLKKSSLMVILRACLEVLLLLIAAPRAQCLARLTADLVGNGAQARGATRFFVGQFVIIILAPLP